MVSKMRLERIKKELSQYDMWMRTGIPQWRISLIERGIVPREDEIEKISQTLECPAEKIFPKEEPV